MCWGLVARHGLIFGENEAYHFRKLFKRLPGLQDLKNGPKITENDKKLENPILPFGGDYIFPGQLPIYRHWRLICYPPH